MLDECKGEKFEELLAGFGVAVCWKCVFENSQPISADVTDEHALALIIAHRKKLENRLQQKRRFNQWAQDFARSLRDRQADLGLRRSKLPQSLQGVPFDEQSLQSLEDAIRNPWVGDERWAEVVLKGDSTNTFGVLKGSFEEQLEAFQQHGSITELSSQSVLRDLAGRVAAQTENYQRWKSFHDSLEAVQKVKERDKKRDEVARPVPVTEALLRGHKELHLGTQATKNLAEGVLSVADRAILESMRKELGALGSKTLSCRGAPEAHSEEQNQEIRSQTLRHSSPPITSKDKTSTHQGNPSVIVAGPVESLLWSPRSFEQTLNYPQRDEISSVSSPATETNLPAIQDVNLTDVPKIKIETGEESVLPAVTPLQYPKGMTLLERTRMSMAAVHSDAAATTMTTMTFNTPPRPDSPPNPAADLSLSSPLKAEQQRSDLLQRTRDSLSFLPSPNSLPSQTTPSQPNRRKTNPGRPKHTKRASQYYFPAREAFPAQPDPEPDEQGQRLETPQKARTLAPPPTPQHRSSTTSPPPIHSGSSTPRERLFSEDADYSSVFKSRPRLALSPALSPAETHDSAGMDSLLKTQMADLALEEDLAQLNTPGPWKRR